MQAVAIILLAVGLLAAGDVLFRAAIARTPPLGTIGTLRDDASRTVGNAARAEAWRWISSTPHERWARRADDGVELVGYWFGSGRQNANTAILLHGHRSDASLMGGIGRFYRSHGFNVFIADARGHGMSGGKFVGMGYLDQADYLGWIRTIVQRVGDNTQIVLHGISMGGSTALMLGGNAALPVQVKAIISDSAYSTLMEALFQELQSRRLPKFPVVALASIQTRIFAGYWFADVNPIRAVAHTNLPTLIVHGAADQRIPVWMAQALFNAAGSTKELWIVPDTGHGEAYFSSHRMEYEHRILTFLSRTKLPHVERSV